MLDIALEWFGRSGAYGAVGLFVVALPIGYVFARGLLKQHDARREATAERIERLAGLPSGDRSETAERLRRRARRDWIDRVANAKRGARW